MQVFLPISVDCSVYQESSEQMAPINERVASLETSMKAIKGILVVLMPTLLLWGWYVTSNVIAIKQSLADGGNTKIVAELEKPRSQAQLQANLSTVIAQIQTAKVQGKSPELKKGSDSVTGRFSSDRE